MKSQKKSHANGQCTNICKLLQQRRISIHKLLNMDYRHGKHPQTVVIFLGNSDDGDLDTLVGHSVLGPVFCTFLN